MPSRSVQIYCSPKCSAKAHKERARKAVPFQPRPCVRCKKVFKPLAGTQKYCKDPCDPIVTSEIERWLNKKPAPTIAQMHSRHKKSLWKQTFHI